MNTDVFDWLVNEVSQWPQCPEPRYQTAINQYIRNGIFPGAFLTSLLSNKLCESAIMCDEKSARKFYLWAQYINESLPNLCNGSPERVNGWIDSGGVIGQMEDIGLQSVRVVKL